MSKMSKISLTVPEDVLVQFKKLCEDERRSVSAQVTLLMLQALKDKEGESK